MLTTLEKQIFRQVITYHRNRIKFLCSQARMLPHIRATFLARARHEANEIKETLRIAKLS
jgi:hypothetical protein